MQNPKQSSLTSSGSVLEVWISSLREGGRKVWNGVRFPLSSSSGSVSGERGEAHLPPELEGQELAGPNRGQAALATAQLCDRTLSQQCVPSGL